MLACSVFIIFRMCNILIMYANQLGLMGLSITLIISVEKFSAVIIKGNVSVLVNIRNTSSCKSARFWVV